MFTKTDHNKILKILWQRVLSTAREKWVVHIQGNPLVYCNLWADFSAKTLQTKREWDDIFKIVKDENCQLRMLYQTRQYFGNEGEIKLFQANKSWRISLPLDCVCEKCWKFFKLKQMNTNNMVNIWKSKTHW